MIRLHAIAAVVLLAAVPAVGKVEIAAPSAILHDGDLEVRVTGLAPAATYELQSDFVTRGGSVWRSQATFAADAQGVIDPEAAAPSSGSWRTASSRALLWSMQKTDELPSTTSVLENDDRSILTITLLQDGKKVETKQIALVNRADGVSTTEIRDPLVGTFYAPYGRTKLPAVIVLGGSEGGINREAAALLASHGFAALALAYFGIDPLPPLLDRIPVETVDHAVAWLQAQSSVDAAKIAILGGSKGAELALVAASLNPAIRAVAAYAPSSVVFQSITYGKGGVTSSWTAVGKELPFAPYVTTEAFSKSQRLVDLYVPTLAAAPAAASIPIERIRGPILLLAGRDDALWPSAEMAGQIAERAKAMNFRYRVVNRTFDDAGHHVARIPNRPTADSVRLGGTAEGLAAAQIESWHAIVEFLQKSLE